MANSEQNNYAKSLKEKIWKTKGTRFNAVRRLKNKETYSIASISLLSIYNIAVPIIQIVTDSSRCPKINSLYTLLSIILSIFILVLSLLEGAKNYQIKAERLHFNAVKLSKLLHELEYITSCESQDQNFNNKLKSVGERYEELIESCPENHETDDYNFFQAEQIKGFSINAFIALLIKTKLYLQNYWLYILCIIVMPVIIIILYISC